jgi:hypothetical protein
MSAEKTKEYDYYLKRSQQYGNRAQAYANQQAISIGKKGTSPTPVRRISAIGFPPTITVKYSDVPIGMYQSYSTERTVDQVVLYSFGQEWHANLKGGGWLNSTLAKQGAVIWLGQTPTKYVARGSDPENLYHEERYLTSVTKHSGNAATLPAHFIINRRGDLLIVNDCNVAFSNNGELSSTCITILLEEALYTSTDTKGALSKATWSAAGGSAQEADYSEDQLATLAILLRKLELAYPTLQSRNTFTQPGVMVTTGYACGEAVPQAAFNGTATHFATSQDWEALFKRIDSYGAITEQVVFDTFDEYSIGMDVPTISEANAIVGTDSNRKYLEQVQIDMLAQRRAYALLTMDKAAYNSNAADGATRMWKRYSDKARQAEVQATAINVPVSGIPADDQPEGVGVAVV